VESTLRSLPGVFDAKAWLMDKSLGEADVLYNPAEVTLEEINRIIQTASGEKHEFTVISVIEGG